jgi:hypothetical protein
VWGFESLHAHFLQQFSDKKEKNKPFLKRFLKFK